MNTLSEEETAALGRVLEKEKVTEYMTSTLLSIVDDLSRPDGRPSVSLRRRSRRAFYSLNAETGALESDENGAKNIITYSWPGNTPSEAWRFGIRPFI